jgi:hypothetical protein
MKKGREKARRKTRYETQPIANAEAIPAPTIFWHPSVSLEKLISDFSEHLDSIIVS